MLGNVVHEFSSRFGTRNTFEILESEIGLELVHAVEGALKVALSATKVVLTDGSRRWRFERVCRRGDIHVYVGVCVLLVVVHSLSGLTGSKGGYAPKVRSYCLTRTFSEDAAPVQALRHEGVVRVQEGYWITGEPVHGVMMKGEEKQREGRKSSRGGSARFG